MPSFIARRFLYMLPILLVVTFIIFLLMYFQPGNAVDKLCGLACPKELRAQLIAHYGLNKPMLVQYFNWLKGVVTQLDFGYSTSYQGPALQALLGENRWLYTLLVLSASMLISWLIAVPIGIYSATHKYSIADHTFTLLGFLGLSIPNFILGLLFLWLVVGVFHLGSINHFFQVGGFLNPGLMGKPWNLTVVLNFLWHFLPPVFIIGAASMAAIIRYMRGSLLDVLGMEYVQTARAKGLRERVVIWKHAVRNAINPLISMLGFWVPYLMEGALIIAVVFNLPQIEKTFIQAIENRDNPVVMSGLFVFSVILLLGNLAADILLAISDPKIRYE
ncbi:MAG TPA: ABC transporter permease [Candidatus Fraserbacteria bacterium]|nr:ABC transporter permease [Candidatus Fraserbacteria bacterium]